MHAAAQNMKMLFDARSLNTSPLTESSENMYIIQLGKLFHTPKKLKKKKTYLKINL